MKFKKTKKEVKHIIGNVGLVTETWTETSDDDPEGIEVVFKPPVVIGADKKKKERKKNK